MSLIRNVRRNLQFRGEDVMKKLLIIILLVIGLFIIVPLSINYGISSGVFGFKPFTTIFNEELWFEFWYNYLPAIIAFAGTILRLCNRIDRMRGCMNLKKKIFLFLLCLSLNVRFMKRTIKLLT